MEYKVDLNCDLGESYGRYHLGMDQDVIPLISSANIACGYHASDPIVMTNTVAMAHKMGVHIGAHTGFPDIMGFGRRNMHVSAEEAKAYTQYQIGALDGICRAQGSKIYHVKPHGAFYNMAAKDYTLAKAICEGIAEISEDMILLGLSNSEMIRAAADTGIRACSEVFADRAYNEDGTLVSRDHKGAMIEDDDLAVARVIRMIKEGVVTSITGKEIPIHVDSVCVHGDGEKALAFVEKINIEMKKEGIMIKPFS